MTSITSSVPTLWMDFDPGSKSRSPKSPICLLMLCLQLTNSMAIKKDAIQNLEKLNAEITVFILFLDRKKPLISLPLLGHRELGSNNAIILSS